MLDVSKSHALQLSDLVSRQPALLDEFWDIALSDRSPHNWRAAWVIKGIWERSPALVEPLLPRMRKALPHLKKNGVKREFLRMLSEYAVPDDEDELGCLLNSCFEWLSEPAGPVAVKIHSMVILLEISKKFPEIIPELKTTIELAMNEGTPGILNRGKKVLKALQKLE